MNNTEYKESCEFCSSEIDLFECKECETVQCLQHLIYDKNSDVQFRCCHCLSDNLVELQESMMFEFFRKFFCKHRYLFVRNIYGDEIVEYGYKRSMYKCMYCGKYKYEKELGND